MTHVRGRRVLIVEDEFLMARELGQYFRSMGAEVVGPAPNIEVARKQIEYADAAVLDVDLNGVNVFPIADELVRRGIPFIFFTGRDDVSIPSRFKHVGYLSKPADKAAVFNALFVSPIDHSRQVSDDDVLATLPKLRLAALLLMESAAPADRLVELTLERALANLEDRNSHESLESWLTALLEDTYGKAAPSLLT